MNWMESLQKAIDYIETNLLEDDLISAENISNLVFSSECNFRTLFRVITGYPLGEYIRNRRLSLAGEEIINTNQSILEIALKYGYDTPESFTKAFTRFHGVSPSQARNQRQGLKTFTRIILKIQAVGGSILDYNIEVLDEIRLVGYQQDFPNGDTEENNKMIPEFVQRCCNQDFDGLCSFTRNGKFADAVIGYGQSEGDILHYIFGVDSGGQEISKPYILKVLPAGKWIRFKCEIGSKEGMQDLWYRIYTEFMPCCSYRIKDRETLEVSYCRNGRDERFLYMPLAE